jgi:hypothetical protein
MPCVRRRCLEVNSQDLAVRADFRQALSPATLFAMMAANRSQAWTIFTRTPPNRSACASPCWRGFDSAVAGFLTQ